MAEIYAGLSLAIGAGPKLARGPSLGAQIMFGSRLGSGLVQMIANKRYTEDFGLYQAIFITKYSHLRSPHVHDTVGLWIQIQLTRFFREFS
jgi:hypothetical protein